MRLFIAIELDTPLKEEISHWMQALSREIRDPRRCLHWVKKDQLHLTLKFLGETKVDRLPALHAALRQAAKQGHSFALSFAKAGHFGGRVVWLGVDAGADLSAKLADLIDEVCDALGFERESRPYRPHITLARSKTNPGTIRFAALPKALKQRTFGPMTVRELSLIQSTLTPQGAVYRTLERFDLVDLARGERHI